MAFASPLLWWPVAAAGLGIVLLHLLSWRRPKPRLLPTARFIPAATQPSRFRRVEPSDLAVLLLRLVALVALGAAAAGPLMRWRREGVARVLVVDRSRAVASLREATLAAESLSAGAAAVRIVAFDSVPGVITRSVSAIDTARRDVAGRLGPALVAAAREANELRAQFDSVETVVISPLVDEQVDRAVPLIVSSSASPVRLHRIAAATSPEIAYPAGAGLPEAADVVGAAAWSAWGAPPAHLRFSRTTLTAADSAFAQTGGALVDWPLVDAPPNAVAGLVAGEYSVVGPLAASDEVPRGSAVAYWHDGRVAATEERVGSGCVRHVAVRVAPRGDFTLRPAFVAFVRHLTAPCATPRFALADPAILRAGGGRMMAGRVTSPDARLQRLLAALALVALGAEMWLRRSRRPVPASLGTGPSRVREAA